MKFSKQRELILAAVRENHIHPTADFVYETLKKDNPNLSLGTVYRNLAVLEKCGAIRKVKIVGHPDRYDGEIEDHAHFVCTECNNIFDIYSRYMNQMSNSVSRKYGFEVNDTQVVITGVCKECRKNVKVKE